MANSCLSEICAQRSDMERLISSPYHVICYRNAMKNNSTHRPRKGPLCIEANVLLHIHVSSKPNLFLVQTFNRNLFRKIAAKRQTWSITRATVENNLRNQRKFGVDWKNARETNLFVHSQSHGFPNTINSKPCNVV